MWSGVPRTVTRRATIVGKMKNSDLNREEIGKTVFSKVEEKH
jgi:hypothetical protein